MQYSTGQVVVHPHHGPARVASTFSRTLGGKEVHYVQLAVDRKGLELAVPVDKAEELGIRPPLTRAQVASLFDQLAAESGYQESQWSRRIKQDMDRLNSGDVHTQAALVRDLIRRDLDKGLSLGERDLLRDARRPVVDELAIVLGLSEEETVTAIEKAVLQGERPDLGGVPDETLRPAG